METGYNLKRLTTATNHISLSNFWILPFPFSLTTKTSFLRKEIPKGRLSKPGLRPNPPILYTSSGQSLGCIQLRSGYPRCVTTGKNDEIFVTDEHNKCIKKISKETETKINQSKDDIQMDY
jgi:hypothetical protein